MEKWKRGSKLVEKYNFCINVQKEIKKKKLIEGECKNYKIIYNQKEN